MPRILLALAFAFAALSASAQQIPRIDVTTLDNGHVVLPASGGIKPIMIVIAFSAKGGDDSGAWNKRFQPVYTKDSGFDYLELADFQGIPSFITKMIMHGMRRSVHEPEKSHLAPFYSAEGSWEALVGASNKSIAYVLLATPSGHVVFQTHGPASDAKSAEVAAELAKLEPRGAR
ncbi:MAG TPA: hypothetical protein VFE06_16395 [Acidobacteriaceae bacterium]|jgi:hypothetical protein|nr:hypothetical protein [Acidobacteriaceae bacterium]